MTFDTQARPTPRADIKRPRWGTPIVGAAALMMGVSLTACIQHVEDPNGVDVTYNGQTHHFAVEHLVENEGDPHTESRILIEGEWYECANWTDCGATAREYLVGAELVVTPPPAPVNEGNDGGHSD